jgi:hypothetical protein
MRKNHIMTRLQVLAILLPGVLSAQTTGGITGTLSDDSGASVANAMVSVTLRGAANGGKFTPTLNVKTGSDGKFALTGLAAGTYTLCAPNASAGLLDPCLWKTSPTTVSVAASAQPATVALVAARGVQVNIQVNDPQGLLAANGAVDDVMIGTKGVSGGSPFLSASLLSRNGAGKTVSLLVPPSQGVGLLVSSLSFQLGDSQGNAYSTPSVLTNITAPALGSSTGATATPVLTVNILGPAGK